MLPFSLSPPSLILESIEEWRQLDLRKMSDEDIDSEFINFLNSIDRHWVTQQPPAKAGGLVLRTKVRIRVIRPV